MNRSVKQWAFVIALLALAIILGSLSKYLGVPSRWKEVIILTAGLSGLAISSYPRLWVSFGFWVLIFAFMGAHVLLMWIVFDLWLPQSEPNSTLLWLIGLGEIFLLQYCLNRYRARVISDHRTRLSSQ
jgi:hypothetical protein